MQGWLYVLYYHLSMQFVYTKNDILKKSQYNAMIWWPYDIQGQSTLIQWPHDISIAGSYIMLIDLVIDWDLWGDRWLELIHTVVSQIWEYNVLALLYWAHMLLVVVRSCL